MSRTTTATTSHHGTSVRSRSRAIRTTAVGGGLLALTLLLAACGGSNDTTSTNGSGHDMGSSGSSSGMPMSPSTSATPSPTGTPASGPHNAADVAFATGMVPHHGQAVAMADLAETRADSPEVTKLATAIKAAQAPEIAQMSGWLAGWGAPVPAADEMAMGMDHDMSSDGMGAGGMAGMMTADQMAQLEGFDGATFDRMWLQSMVAHHQGAVAMSKAELVSGTNPDAKKLARAIIAAQQAEIVTMRGLLAG